MQDLDFIKTQIIRVIGNSIFITPRLFFKKIKRTLLDGIFYIRFTMVSAFLLIYFFFIIAKVARSQSINPTNIK